MNVKVAVIDTNVAVTANGDASHVSEECELICVEVLERLVSSGIIVIDDQDLIMTEYEKHLSYAGQPGVGDMLFKHIFDHQYDVNKIERAQVTILNDDARMFDQFPDDDRLKGFDQDDRMFVAAAVASALSPPILNALDSDWSPVEDVLASLNINVVQLCPSDLKEA